jgi:hypothetical protein
MYNPMFDTFAPVYMIESLADAGPVLLSKAVAPKRACDRYSDAAIDEMFPKHVFENITPDAVIDQTIAFAEKNYDQLMGIYALTDSEVEQEVVRLAVMAEDWTVEFLNDGDAAMMVMRNGFYDGKYTRRVWAKCFVDDLRNDAQLARRKSDEILAKFLDGLADDLEMTWAEFQAQEWEYKRRPTKW